MAMTAATVAIEAAMTKNTERAAAIRWIQEQMADYGLTMEELEAAGCFDPPPPPPPPLPPAVCYRNAEGLTWDGQGEMPSSGRSMRGSRWSFTGSGPCRAARLLP